MNVTFEDKLKVVGIGMVPWTRTGPERWIKDYAIASLTGWDIEWTGGTNPVYTVEDTSTMIAKMSKINTQSMLNTLEFQELLNRNLPDYNLLTYKPVKLPSSLKDRKLLAVDPKFTNIYENKVRFREIFGDKLKFPEYKVINRNELLPNQELFSKLLSGRKSIIIQDEELSGGKGTFKVSDFDGYIRTVSALDKLSKSQRVVVSSEVLNKRERSIQAIVTEEGVFIGPIQRQIIAHPLLSAINVPDGDKFCGIEINMADQSTDLHDKTTAYARVIGLHLKNAGYRGIFGVDFLVDHKDEVYVLEVNPRITGATPLLTSLFNNGEGIPFYLLHILELANHGYKIHDDKQDFSAEGSLVVMHSTDNKSHILSTVPASGTYKVHDTALTKVSDNVDIKSLEKGEFIIQKYVPEGMRIKPGGRLLTVYFSERIIDENTEDLYNSIKFTIKLIKNNIKFS